MADLEALFNSLLDTNFTKSVHRKLYPTVDPSQPQLAQEGKVVLIPGGGTGIGRAIARSFVRASADTVIIIARRSSILDEAAAYLKEEAKNLGSPTKIITRSCDITNAQDIAAFWNYIEEEKIIIDVLVANAAKFTEPKPILELGADEVWSQMEVNAKAAHYLAEKFCAQTSSRQKFLINVATQAIHMTAHPGVAQRPAYTFSKMAGTLLFQLIAQSTPADQLQVISFHPGLIYNDAWKTMGLPENKFDSDELCGGFAVWAATKQAEFLHGRFVWAAWDVDELSTGPIRKRIDEDPYFLRCSIVGLNGSNKA